MTLGLPYVLRESGCFEHLIRAINRYCGHPTLTLHLKRVRSGRSHLALTSAILHTYRDRIHSRVRFFIALPTYRTIDARDPAGDRTD